jgi:hypothetical protein
MNNTTCIIIIVIIFLILAFIVASCDKKLDYCEIDDEIENFDERLIKNGSKRKILKDKLRKEFVNSGRASVTFLYNSLKTNNGKRLFRTGPDLRLTPEQQQDIINSLKADNTNKSANNDQSNSETFVQIACSAYNAFTACLKAVPWQLLEQIYGDAVGLESQNPQTRLNSEIAIGLDLLNYALGLAGLGFLSGPLAIFAGLTKKSAPPLPESVILAKIVSDTTLYSDITHFMTAQNDYFGAVNNFIIDYIQNKKYNQQVLCPYPIGCQTEGSGSTKRCDPDAQSSAIRTCMLSPFSQDPTIRYDPNILYSTMPSQFATNSNDSSITKRAYLKKILTDPNNALSALVTGTTSSAAASSTGITAMMSFIYEAINSDTPGAALGVCIGFLPQFIIIMTYTVTYYHELALLDERILSYQTGYENPWISDVIGDTTCLYIVGQGWNDQASSQNTTNLLGKLQDICKSFQIYINTTFEVYFNGLTVTTGTWDNGCCDSPFSCCLNFDGKCGERCVKYPAWGITDSANSGKNQVIPNDTTAPNNTKDWYGAMRTKYPSYYFYYPESLYNRYTDGMNDGIALVIYMNCFREFLNFPYKHFLDYCKMAGYTVPANITSDQLYYNTLNKLLPQKGYSPANLGIPPSIPFDLTNTRTYNMDLSGGYPFGLDSPSYREGIQKWLTPNEIVLSDSSSLLQDTYKFNTYCSPIRHVTPGELYDATEFNIEGDDASRPWDKAACRWSPESSSHTVGMVSCLKGGLFPGTSNNIIPNSRTAFCVDISGSGSTYKAIASPLMRSIPGNIDPSFTPKSIKTFPAVFTYTGNKEIIFLPSNVTKINFYCWGAGGGGGTVSEMTPGIPPKGGGGACISGTINYSGDILEIIIGQGGIAPQDENSYPAFGGGAIGGITKGPNYTGIRASSGGGYSSIGIYNMGLLAIAGAGGGAPLKTPYQRNGHSAISTENPTDSRQSAGGMPTYQGGNGWDIVNINTIPIISGGGGGGGGYRGGLGGEVDRIGELYANGGNGGTSFIDITSVTNIQRYDGGLNPTTNNIPGGINIPQYTYGEQLGIGYGGSRILRPNPNNPQQMFGQNGGNGMVVLEIAQ